MKRLLLPALCLIALPAAAHGGHAPEPGFLAGLLHPFSGADHLLAMLGVGMWSRRQGQPLSLPLTFLAMMALGAFLQTGLPLPESALAASVLVLGVLLAAARLPSAMACIVVGLFAVLHGQAHGCELPAMASAAGYLLSSAALLLAGRAIGQTRWVSALMASAGLCLLAGTAFV
ncbi:HupE/UreJ family protein [Massilia sp. CF038]|uniref:HupE/UreJ family protein n=1 Tax=Massilia sp. CF038 TaxID=1881045 RepID=UPI00091F1062|nr:HupE/UreJ family protein [Massilia sp. CF038]SHG99738.1 urease accessory protein [Massilia sp. CF038]